jgi:hypothetical protein
VETALRLTLAYVKHRIGDDAWRKAVSGYKLNIIILGDNDFYSQREQVGAFCIKEDHPM